MILVQGFWLPRIKIIQFTGGFRPNFRDLTIILDTHLTFLTPKKEEYFIRGWRFTRNSETAKNPRSRQISLLDPLHKFREGTLIIFTFILLHEKFL